MLYIRMDRVPTPPGGYTPGAITIWPVVLIRRDSDSPCLKSHELYHWWNQLLAVLLGAAIGALLLNGWGALAGFVLGEAAWFAVYIAIHVYLMRTDWAYRQGQRRRHPMERPAYRRGDECARRLHP